MIVYQTYISVCWLKYWTRSSSSCSADFLWFPISTPNLCLSEVLTLIGLSWLLLLHFLLSALSHDPGNVNCLYVYICLTDCGILLWHTTSLHIVLVCVKHILARIMSRNDPAVNVGLFIFINEKVLLTLLVRYFMKSLLILAVRHFMPNSAVTEL